MLNWHKWSLQNQTAEVYTQSKRAVVSGKYLNYHTLQVDGLVKVETFSK